MDGCVSEAISIINIESPSFNGASNYQLTFSQNDEENYEIEITTQFVRSRTNLFEITTTPAQLL